MLHQQRPWIAIMRQSGKEDLEVIGEAAYTQPALPGRRRRTFHITDPVTARATIGGYLEYPITVVHG